MCCEVLDFVWPVRIDGRKLLLLSWVTPVCVWLWMFVNPTCYLVKPRWSISGVWIYRRSHRRVCIKKVKTVTCEERGFACFEFFMATHDIRKKIVASSVKKKKKKRNTHILFSGSLVLKLLVDHWKFWHWWKKYAFSFIESCLPCKLKTLCLLTVDPTK